MKEWPPSSAQIVQIFNARATTYDKSQMHHWLAQRTVDQAHLSCGMTVLDLGAGTGLAVRDAAHRLNGQGHFIAVDIARDLLAVAGAEAEGKFVLRLIQADAQNVPLPEQTVDVALCVAVLAYIAQPVEALREWGRLLKPGGQLVFQTFAADTMAAPRLLREAAAELGLHLTDPNSALGTPERCAEALHDAGLQLASIDEDIWREPLPEANTFWSATIDGVMSEYMARLPGALTEAIKERFLSKLSAHRSHSETDAYRVLFVCARPA